MMQFLWMHLACVIGDNNPNGGDWNPLQGQSVVGVRTEPTSATDIGSSSNSTGSAPPSQTSKAVEELTEMLSTDAIYIVETDFGINDSEATLECDSDKDLLLRWAISSSGTATASSNTGSYSAVFGTIEDSSIAPSFVDINLVKLSDIYTAPTYTLSENSKGIISGLCLPLGG